MAGMVTDEADFPAALSALRAAGPEIYAAASFWWTAGGGNFRSLALSCRGLPNPYRYSTLLTGDLGEMVHAG
jgi:type VI secretion system protein ImpM